VHRSRATRCGTNPLAREEEEQVAQLTHKVWMDRALTQARAAMEHDDVPIGAVVVRDGEVIAEAHNRREIDGDPTAHAEILALREAARAVGSWRLERCTLYVTLEPCSMCAGALVLARLPELVFAATDPKAGAVGSLYDIAREPRLNHQVEVVSGVLAEECGRLLRRFFQARRAPSRAAGLPVSPTFE
jgi:tRNA(adenine34) deaminase